jgi:hypothetical protein
MRTQIGRRTKTLVAQFVAEAGGPSAVTPVQMLRIRRAAELVVAAERMRAASLHDPGAGMAMFNLVRLENLASRAVEACRLDQRRPPEMELKPTPYHPASGDEP